MFIHTFKINLKLVTFILITVILLSSIFIFYSFATDITQEDANKKDFIKWVDFNVSYDALKLTAKLDIKSHTENSSTTYNWIEL